ncbi:MAG TPA: right-handed parallel beta-helix repeat-containing protein [Thermoanaerobaculia bacterium]|nr:right-handed parallel beta-helix repeat-containing protein [Thermoanaerobaculia bacterium]
MTSFNRVRIFLSFFALLGLTGPATAATFVVNAAAPAGGDGSPERPLRSLRAAEEASGPGDTIVLVRGSGPYDESITLERGQTLSASAEPAAAALPVIRVKENAAIVARDAADLTIRDIAIELSGSANGIALHGATGTVSIRGSSITGATSGKAIDVEGGDAAITVEAAVITGADFGVELENVKGTFAIAGGTIRDVRKRGIAIVKSSGITVRETKFINTPATNAAPAARCGTPTAAGDHLVCGAAIHLQGVDGITLERVVIEDSQQTAITGDAVRDLTMTAVEIRGAGDENNEHGVQLRNVAGNARISGARFEGSEARHLYFVQDSGEATIDVRDSTFRGAAPPNGQQGILLQSSGDARVQIIVAGSTFVDNFGNAVQLIAEGKAAVTAEITGSTFRKNSTAVTATAADDASLQYRIAKNKIEESASTALNIHGTTRNTVSGEIVDNAVNGATCGGGCNGISVTALGRGTSTAVIARNTIARADANGILARGGGDATLHVRIAGNTIREPAGTDALYAILVTAGMRKADRAAVCAELGGAGDLVNTISGSWNAAGGGAAIGLTRAGESTSLGIARYAGQRTNSAGLSKFVAGGNRGAAVEASIAGGVTLTDGCTIGEY